MIAASRAAGRDVRLDADLGGGDDDRGDADRPRLWRRRGIAAAIAAACRRRGGARARVRQRRPADLGVETAAQQIGFFGALSFADQRDLLEEMVEPIAPARAARSLRRDWVRGNVEASATRSATRRRCSTMLDPRRNRALDRLADAPARPAGHHLFAVGAGIWPAASVVDAAHARGHAASLIASCSLRICRPNFVAIIRSTRRHR